MFCCSLHIPQLYVSWMVPVRGMLWGAAARMSSFNNTELNADLKIHFGDINKSLPFDFTIGKSCKHFF